MTKRIPLHDELTTLTRVDLYRKIQHHCGLTYNASQMLSDSMLAAIIEALQQQMAVPFKGLGVLEVVQKNARPGRNPKTSEPITILPRKNVTFRGKSQMANSNVLVTKKMTLPEIFDAIGSHLSGRHCRFKVDLSAITPTVIRQAWFLLLDFVAQVTELQNVRIEFRGLGTLVPVNLPQRQTRNPKDGSSHLSPATTKLHYRMSRDLFKYLNPEQADKF